VQHFFLSNLNAKFVVFKWGFASMEGCSFDFSTTWFMMGNEYCKHLVCDSMGCQNTKSSGFCPFGAYPFGLVSGILIKLVPKPV
jgi:hypothetical protein